MTLIAEKIKHGNDEKLNLPLVHLHRKNLQDNVPKWLGQIVPLTPGDAEIMKMVKPSFLEIPDFQVLNFLFVSLLSWNHAQTGKPDEQVLYLNEHIKDDVPGNYLPLDFVEFLAAIMEPKFKPLFEDSSKQFLHTAQTFFVKDQWYFIYLISYQGKTIYSFVPVLEAFATINNYYIAMKNIPPLSLDKITIREGREL